MHPYDVKRSLDWVVHLIGKIMVASWLGALLAFVISAATEMDAVRILLGYWPLVIGLWLWYSKSPTPLFIDEEEDESDEVAAR